MADKIIITSDGTAKGTNVKVNGMDMTKDYKVTSIYFSAHGGYTYKSQYSGDTYVNPPSVSYDVSYLDGDKRKSMGVSTPSHNTEYGSLAQKDSIGNIGIDNDERIKTRILDELDKLRDKNDTIPKRILLEKRTLASLTDKYVDVVKELEEVNKKEKESK